MAPRQQLDPVPQFTAGVVTVKCKCGWEMVFILPEEAIVLMNHVFGHLKQMHGVDFPEICCYWH